jgi:hypothetical protein
VKYVTSAWIAWLAALVGCVQTLAAQNIDMSTLPVAGQRSNSRSTTPRTSPSSARRGTSRFERAVNELQFSWANTLIDADERLAPVLGAPSVATNSS